MEGSDCNHTQCKLNGSQENCGLFIERCNDKDLCSIGGFSLEQMILIIGIGVAALCMLMTSIIMLVRRRKKYSAKNSKRMGDEPEEDDGYNMVNELESTNELENMYGDVNEDLELNETQNPYYGNDVEVDTQNRYNQIENLDSTIITTTKNIYYEM